MRSKSKNKILEHLDELTEKQLLESFFEVLGKNDMDLADDMLRSISQDKRRHILDSFQLINLKRYAEAEYILWQSIELQILFISLHCKKILGKKWDSELEASRLNEIKKMENDWLKSVGRIEAPEHPSDEHSYAQSVITASKNTLNIIKEEMKYAPDGVFEE